jgi:hypothetical protein
VETWVVRLMLFKLTADNFVEVSLGLSDYSFEACEDLGPRVEKEEGVGQNDDAGFCYRSKGVSGARRNKAAARFTCIHEI